MSSLPHVIASSYGRLLISPPHGVTPAWRLVTSSPRHVGSSWRLVMSSPRHGVASSCRRLLTLPARAVSGVVGQINVTRPQLPHDPCVDPMLHMEQAKRQDEHSEAHTWRVHAWVMGQDEHSEAQAVQVCMYGARLPSIARPLFLGPLCALSPLMPLLQAQLQLQLDSRVQVRRDLETALRGQEHARSQHAREVRAQGLKRWGQDKVGHMWVRQQDACRIAIGGTSPPPWLHLPQEERGIQKHSRAHTGTSLTGGD